MGSPIDAKFLNQENDFEICNDSSLTSKHCSDQSEDRILECENKGPLCINESTQANLVPLVESCIDYKCDSEPHPCIIVLNSMTSISHKTVVQSICRCYKAFYILLKSFILYFYILWLLYQKKKNAYLQQSKKKAGSRHEKCFRVLVEEILTMLFFI